MGIGVAMTPLARLVGTGFKPAITVVEDTSCVESSRETAFLPRHFFDVLDLHFLLDFLLILALLLASGDLLPDVCSDDGGAA